MGQSIPTELDCGLCTIPLFLTEKVIHFIHYIAVHLWQHVIIDMQRRADVGVPEYLLYHFRRNPHAQEDSCRAMAQVMKAHIR